ncbi:MAG TPA: hypothetical protein VNS09_01480 [Solirubrobacter sp.]|nr:hypothetical protein [Solirubrobacter sp.]
MRTLALAACACAALATSALLGLQLRQSLNPEPPLPAPVSSPAAPITHRIDRTELGPRFLGVPLPVLIALEVAGGVLGLATSMVGLGVRRARSRRHREYARYVLHLSSHDEAKPQDVQDLMEAVAHVVRALPTERARSGQPFVAFELDHDVGESGGFEWSLVVRCPPRLVIALDGALSAAYPDARLGRMSGEAPQPSPDRTGEPGFVMRFRKQRGFVYPLLPGTEEHASPPMEAIAHAQCSLNVPSTIRFTLTPAPDSLEAVAHRLFRRHENRLVRQERWGLPEAGLHSTLNRAEMTNASRAQNRALFWLELAIAAPNREICRQLAASVQARRGENRLRRRWMPIRQSLYQRRFAAATPPLVPSPRALISAAEAAHLLALPTARMKGVPVRRVAVPRIPMPPEVLRAVPDTEVAAPRELEVVT